MDKKDAAYMQYNRILPDQEKDEIVPFAEIWMDLESIT